MKILSMNIRNFRQFYGEQSIVFSNDTQKPITVIHGENGSGKTALLNAFKWILYGITDFEEEGNKLLNERAQYELKIGESIIIELELTFENENKKYIARRIQKFRKDDRDTISSKGGSVLKLEYKDISGEYKSSNNPDTEIQQIIPIDLHTYFFFNGERIDKLANSSSSEEIKIAIKKLLGIEIIERAEQHMTKYVLKELRKDLKSVTTADSSEKIEEQNQLIEEIEKQKNNLVSLNKNKNEIEKELNTIDTTMKEKKEIAILQNERLTLERENEKYNENLIDIKNQRRVYISKYGFVGIVEQLIRKTETILEEKRIKGELPSNIKEQFIKDLLDKELCICGRELQPDSESYKEIAKYLKKAVPSDVDDAFIKTNASLAGLKKERKSFYENIKRYLKSVKNLEENKRKNIGRLDEISNLIGKTSIEDLEKLEIRRDDLKDKREKCIGDIAITKNHLLDLEKKNAQITNEIKQVKAKNKIEELAKNRLDFATEVTRVITEIYGVISESVKENLSEKVNKAFTGIMRKDYSAEISKDYSLNIYKKIKNKSLLVHEKSTGENQVASLSFIGSIVSLCKENYDSNKMKYMKGGIFPIVMDSPYGALDKEYRTLVAQTIPELADQIIIMVSDSQWSGEVENELKALTGKQYTLMYHAPNLSSKTKSKSVIKDEYEFTEIKEGYYGR